MGTIIDSLVGSDPGLAVIAILICAVALFALWLYKCEWDEDKLLLAIPVIVLCVGVYLAGVVHGVWVAPDWLGWFNVIPPIVTP